MDKGGGENATPLFDNLPAVLMTRGTEEMDNKERRMTTISGS
jgi:hypothetical protein